MYYYYKNISMKQLKVLFFKCKKKRIHIAFSTVNIYLVLSSFASSISSLSRVVLPVSVEEVSVIIINSC